MGHGGSLVIGVLNVEDRRSFSCNITGEVPEIRGGTRNLELPQVVESLLGRI